MPKDLAEHAGLDVALDDDDAGPALEAGDDQRSRLVQSETARVDAAGRTDLDEAQLAGVGVDAEADERVRGDGRVGAVEGGDLEGLFAAGGDDDEFVVGLFFFFVNI